ncbi:MAG: hypothetical protein RLZZ537_912 [Pseudomonadota bacterium]|jgi:hypothetical protein
MLMKSRILHSFAAIALLGLALQGCAKKDDAPQVDESRLFSSPEAAVDAFVSALEKQDTTELVRILGQEGSALLPSGDAINDAQERDEFLADYKAKHSLQSDGERKILVIGTNDWPFPIPVAKQGNKWFLDTLAGADELIFRRIGENELGAIAVSRGYVDAQKEYASLGRDGGEAGVYAMKILSDEGRQNGLYWPTMEDEAPSPIGAFVAEAAAEGYRTESATAYHGYRYRLLYRQGDKAAGGAKDYFVDGRLTGGFAMIAWPADYGNSGVKSFLINQDGTVFEKDLGETTEEAAAAIDSFNPDEGWKAVPAQ